MGLDREVLPEEPPGEGGDETEKDAPTTADKIARGASWSLVGQIAPMIITVFLTPYILHGLGVTRYGLFVLTGSLVSFLGTFDGGVKSTAQRYFAVYAGEAAIQKSMRLMLTLLIVIAVIGSFVSTVGWFVASPLISLIGVPVKYHPESVFLFRTLGILITFLFFHSVFVSIIQAYGRYDYIVKASLGVYVIWALGLVMTVRLGWGLWGIAAVFMVQQLFLALVIIPGSLRYLRGGEVGFMRRQEVIEFFQFSWRVQLSNISSLINMEFDTVIIGAAVSARAVSFYNAGANFGENIGSIPAAALAPAQTVMGNTFGQRGRDATFEQYKRLQHVWVIGMSGWFAAGGSAAYFAIVVWLGKEFRVAGVIAVISLATWAISLFGGIFRTYLTVVGEPGLEMRYGIWSVVANVVLTIPFLLFGPIGVAAATGIGQLFGMFYLLHVARRKVSTQVPNPLRSIPLLPTLVTVAVVVALELAVYRHVPGGGVGLLCCAAPALVGLVAFMSAVFGPVKFLHFGADFLRQTKESGYRIAAADLVNRMAA